jgi:ribosome-associated protein
LSESGKSEIQETEHEAPQYEPLESDDLAIAIARIASEKKAEKLVAMRVRELVQYTDYFIILSGHSDRQVAALRDHIQKRVKAELGLPPFRVEGTDNNHWVILDFSDVVVHIFYEPTREFYNLEELWEEAPHLELDFIEKDYSDSYSSDS